ncbi:Copper-transporting ATPase [Melia azedarach]|uniref:Copper-transporting ATPase n=1 Tax=Melia azedarach TaxID=155640 RepID=A0ACC1XMF3_MELAZ|nr:Copper-transporting ATPase [Melia azedarach]
MQVRSIMVTGDNWGTAKSIANEVGIETVIAQAKPEQKAEKVKELQVSGYTVAMVGSLTSTGSSRRWNGNWCWNGHCHRGSGYCFNEE